MPAKQKTNAVVKKVVEFRCKHFCDAIPAFDPLMTEPRVLRVVVCGKRATSKNVNGIT
jgi:hypothetical protein